MNRVLIIGTVWPEPKSSAAGTRMLQLIKLFLNQKYEVHFATSAENLEFSFDLKTINVHLHQLQLNDSSCDSVFSEINANIVVFDRFMIEEQFGWRIREILPNALTILDTEDLHFLREARQLALKYNSKRIEDYLFSDKTKRELASILRCDLSLIISKVELNLLQEKFKISSDILVFLPFWVEDVPSVNPDFYSREDFLFIGNFYHEPNIDAVKILKSEIWPRIRDLDKNLKLNIYGAYLPDKIQQLHNPKEGFFIRGRAEEVGHVMRDARVFLAPLRFGAGQKGKLLESMLFDLPSITTTIGAESMSENEKWNGFISDDWDEFAQKAIEIYHSDVFWKNAINQGNFILKNQFLDPTFRTEFINRIEEIIADLKGHRNSHFLSQILQLNTLNSYKFMSKWIEEKNRKKD